MNIMNKAFPIAGLGLALGLAACQDLNVTNPNNPEREVVVESAGDIEALIATSFRRWFNLSQGSAPSIALSAAADEFSSGFTDFGVQLAGAEPRTALDNDASAPNSPNRGPISTLFSIISATNIALQAIDRYDLRLMSGSTDNTARGQAFAKFVQGISHSYAALVYDRAWVYSETVDTDTIRFVPGSTQVQDLIRPYPEVRDTAVAQLEVALAIAQANAFTLPAGGAGDWLPGVSMSNTEFARLINSFIARTLAYAPRSPAERAQVDWERVIRHIDAGITSDFEPLGTPSVVTSVFKNRASRHRTTTPGDFMRVDYMVVGPADQSASFRNWVATPWANRQPFIMQDVRDARILSTPGAACTSNTANSLAVEGSYIGCHLSTVFAADRGLGQRSYYYFHRLGRLTAWESGPLLAMNTVEMDLIKAEALIRLGRAAEAVPLINATRVGNGNLPPVTLEGVPLVNGNCTPRKLDGTCGSLWDALRYEKRIEGLGIDGAIAHWDARGWGALVEGTPVHYPMPGNELELLGLPMYTFGGIAGGAAPAPAPETCPVALPRC